MTTKRFINTNNMRDEMLALLQKEFLTKQFFGDKIEIKLDIKDIVDKCMTENNITEPIIYITVSAYQKIMTLVKKYTSEVAWHCLINHPEGTNTYLIYDVLVFPQEVTGATANGIDNEYEMWLATLPDEQFNRCRCHMHSHVNMNVTPSGVDENYYNNLMTQVTDYYITMIINKREEFHLRFYDVTNNILYIDKDLIVCFDNGITVDNWFNSVKDNVKEKTFKSYIPTKDNKNKKDDDDPYNYQYTLDEFYKKKVMEDTPTVGNGRGRPKKKESIEKSTDKMVTIQGPNNDTYNFISIDWAVNFVYNRYPENNHRFSKNDMRKYLAKNGAIAYDPAVGEFIYDFLDKDGGLEYAILKCDMWEVIKK